MMTNANQTAAHRQAIPLTLADVVDRLKSAELAPARRRDLLSAVKRIGALLGAPLERLPADPAVLRTRLDPLLPARLGLSPKTYANVKSSVLAAITIAIPAVRLSVARQELSSEWQELLAAQSKRLEIGLSAFAHYCSSNGLPPASVTPETLAAFTYYRDKNRFGPLPTGRDSLERLWNEAARRGHNSGLQEVPASPKRERPGRVSWDSLPQSFRKDVEAHLTWASGKDLFASDARPRPLASQSLRLRRNYIHSAVTAYVAGGGVPDDLVDLAALVTPEAFRTVLQKRHAAGGKVANAYTSGLAQALTDIAKGWARVSPAHLTELKRLRACLPNASHGLTQKNKAVLRAFDDPRMVERLIELPANLLTQSLRERPSERRLARAQAAIAIAILIYGPLRGANLRDLRFEATLFVPDDDSAETIVEIPGAQVKNGEPFATVLPPDVTRLLRIYRDRILAPMLASAPTFLFGNGKGGPKGAKTLADLIDRTLRRSLGIKMTPHQFRHLAAKLLLDAEPGAYETARQLLGHRNLKTTVNSYAGVDTKRASRFHAKLVQERLRRAR